MPSLLVTCPALGANRRIPLRHVHRLVRGGENVSLPLSWSEPPLSTRTMVVTVVDHHPIARRWVHWCVAGIPPDIRALLEGASLHPEVLPAGAIETINSFDQPGYGGPAPPGGTGPHEYVMTVYALDDVPRFLPLSLTEEQIERLIRNTVIASGDCTGVFERA